MKGSLLEIENSITVPSMEPPSIADVIEIEQLLARYAIGMTKDDIDTVMSVFTDDGTYSAFGDTYTLRDFPTLVQAAPKGLFLTARRCWRSMATSGRASRRCASWTRPSRDAHRVLHRHVSPHTHRMATADALDDISSSERRTRQRSSARPDEAGPDDRDAVNFASGPRSVREPRDHLRKIGRGPDSRSGRAHHRYRVDRPMRGEPGRRLAHAFDRNGESHLDVHRRVAVHHHPPPRCPEIPRRVDVDGAVPVRVERQQRLARRQPVTVMRCAATVPFGKGPAAISMSSRATATAPLASTESAEDRARRQRG